MAVRGSRLFILLTIEHHCNCWDGKRDTLVAKFYSRVVTVDDLIMRRPKNNIFFEGCCMITIASQCGLTHN